MSLKGKNFLITAGPTWIAIDKARVISNIATGENGIILAEELVKQGAGVTLVLGPVNVRSLNQKIRLLRFNFFDQLKSTVLGEIKRRAYDCVLHSAAVSDYAPEKSFGKKVASDKRSLNLKLIPTPKIIDLIRKADRKLLLVGFKFEPDSGKKTLLKAAGKFMKRSGADLVVTNSLSGGNKYLAYITDGAQTSVPFRSRKELCAGLVKLLKQFYG